MTYFYKSITYRAGVGILLCAAAVDRARVGLPFPRALTEFLIAVSRAHTLHYVNPQLLGLAR